MSMAIVRFKVGEDEEKSIVRLNQKLFANFDLIPPGASPPLVKPRSIDDVPILALTLSGAGYDPFTLRRVAAQLHDQIKEVPDVSEVKIIGGQRRQVRVDARPGPDGVPRRRAGSDRAVARGRRTASCAAGSVSRGQPRDPRRDRRRSWRTRRMSGAWSSGCPAGGPSSCATSPTSSTARRSRPTTSSSGTARPARRRGRALVPAVTISVAKRKGTNAIVVADEVLEKVDGLRGRLIPADVPMTVTRNYGETAAEKSNELLLHMLIAVLSVSILIGVRARPARVGHRRDRDPGDARAHARRLLPLRLHAEPRHAVRADLLDRHPGRRRDRRRREHRPALPPARERGAAAGRRRGRGGRRGRQPDDPRDVHGDRRDPADGVRPRADGALHAADPGRRVRGDALLAARRVHRDAVGGRPAAQARGRRPRPGGGRRHDPLLPPGDGPAARAARSTGTASC